jgi:hypothetical protein
VPGSAQLLEARVAALDEGEGGSVSDVLDHVVSVLSATPGCESYAQTLAARPIDPIEADLIVRGSRWPDPEN